MTRKIDDLPPEFYLPPRTAEALAKETRFLVTACITFIVALGVVGALTQDIVVSLR